MVIILISVTCRGVALVKEGGTYFNVDTVLKGAALLRGQHLFEA